MSAPLVIYQTDNGANLALLSLLRKQRVLHGIDFDLVTNPNQLCRLRFDEISTLVIARVVSTEVVLEQLEKTEFGSFSDRVNLVWYHIIPPPVGPFSMRLPGDVPPPDLSDLVGLIAEATFSRE